LQPRHRFQPSSDPDGHYSTPWASGSFPGNDKILPKKALFLKRPQNFIGEIFTFTQDFQNFENEVAPFW
jgi:hypothetical protein